MSEDVIKDYTKLRRLRSGEWRSRQIIMKETKDKTILKWIKKRKRQAVLWCGIILVIVPLIVYGLSEISFLPVTGENDWAGFWGGYFGAIIGGICTVAGVFLTIQYERERGKDDAERAVLPYIALTTLERENSVDLFHLKDLNGINDKEDNQGYREFSLERIYFIISGEEIKASRKLSKEQQVILENNGNYAKEIASDSYVIMHRKMISIPIILENVGKGAAVDFRVGVHLGNTKYNDEGLKYTGPKHLTVGKTFYVNIYFEDISEYIEKIYFILRICYENIYTQAYIQEYPISIENGILQLDLGQIQRKVSS